MLKNFINDDFLLNNKYAKDMYHLYVADLPIYDYHCHLDASEITLNRNFNNISELWLAGDHYKWRAMRFLGIDEKYITGDATPKVKFLKWAESMPKLIGNPLYHFSHLELARYFDIYKLLNKENAESIWSECNEKLQDSSFTPQNIIKRSNVEFIGTTDDPTDSLEDHIKLKDDKFFTEVTPSFRPDRFITINPITFPKSVQELSLVQNQEISNFSDYLDILLKRIQYFSVHGCRISDFSLEIIDFKETDLDTASSIFNSVMKNELISQEKIIEFQSFMIIYLGKIYSSLNWVMQIHVGAQRNNSSRMLSTIGINSGFDSINDQPIASLLLNILNSLDKTNELPKTILYTLNPSANTAIASMIGSFQGSSIPGKVQFGSAWWLNDNYEGINEHLKTLSNLGVLGVFIGMLTDSRCLLSYTRHEYFRRILCQLLGEWMGKGIIPNNLDNIGLIATDISYENAKKYFDNNN